MLFTSFTDRCAIAALSVYYSYSITNPKTNKTKQRDGQEPIRTVVCSNLGLARQGISYMLAGCPEIDLVDQSDNWHEAAQLAHQSNADVVIANSTTLSPLEVAEQLKGPLRVEAPQARLIILSHSDNPKLAQSTVRAGAAGYALASDVFANLRQAVQEVNNGYRYISPKIAADVAALPHRSNNHLSNRESEVLCLLAYGYTNKEIASLIFLSPRTVESYRININNKLGFRHRHQLVSYALQRGLMTTPD